MYKQLLISFFILFGNLLYSNALEEQHPFAEMPNFVLILVDDAALQDFGVYGGQAYTSNIDALAYQRTMFTNYHSSLMCAPARAMLLTGCDSHLASVTNLPVFLAPEFFSYLPFQAIHIPVQDPAEFIKKYIGVYKDGWNKIKQQRFEKAKQLGLIQKDAIMAALHPELRAWDKLSTAIHKNGLGLLRFGIMRLPNKL